MDDATIGRLSRYASSFSYGKLPEKVVHQAKRLIIDTIGCALGGLNGTPVRIACSLAREFGGTRCATVLGTSLRTSVDWAAFANGTMARYLDFNDTFAGRDNAHPTDNLAVVLAAAESRGTTGAALISGFVAAYEIQAAFADSHKIREAGPWDQAAYASISTALGVGHVMGLNEQQIANALRLSALQGLLLGQARVGELSHAKASTVALVGRNAIAAALLAEKGFTGPALAMEGPFGFFKGLAGHKFELALLAGEHDNDADFRIMRSHIKRFPAGFYAQSAIEAALDCRLSLGIEHIGEIRRIELKTFENAIFAMAADEARWRPHTRESADHSLPFVIAMALRDGRVETDQFMASNFADPVVCALMDKIEVEQSAECQAAWPEAILNILTVETMDGRTHTARKPYHEGHARLAMSDKAIEAKFHTLSQGTLSAEQRGRALAALWRIEENHDLPDLLALLNSTLPDGPSLRKIS
jgi:2-methylcitrate dehydratase